MAPQFYRHLRVCRVFFVGAAFHAIPACCVSLSSTVRHRPEAFTVRRAPAGITPCRYRVNTARVNTGHEGRQDGIQSDMAL